MLSAHCRLRAVHALPRWPAAPAEPSPRCDGSQHRREATAQRAPRATCRSSPWTPSDGCERVYEPVAEGDDARIVEILRAADEVIRRLRAHAEVERQAQMTVGELAAAKKAAA